MDARGGLVPALWSGTSTAVKLLIASLAFAGAYTGVRATGGPSETAAPAPRTVVLSAQAMPAEEARVPAAGVISVAATPSTGCVRTYHVQSVVESGGRDVVLYGWRLQRWSTAGREWLPYTASATAGFAGGDRTVTWHPRIVDNPGLYRVRLVVNGKAVLSEMFRVIC